VRVPTGERQAMSSPADDDGGLRRDAVLPELYRAHYRSLVGLACLLVDRRDVGEELVQEAFLRLHRDWDRVREPERADAWLRSTTMNLARSRLRRGIAARRADERARTVAPVPSTGSCVDGAYQAVVDAVRRLPRRQREVVVLRYWLDLDEAAIAAELGISAGSVKTHAHRAMQALAADLGHDEEATDG
jgi:RNA polymerase sigma-70 factor (sigma-E family)